MTGRSSVGYARIAIVMGWGSGVDGLMIFNIVSIMAVLISRPCLSLFAASGSTFDVGSGGVILVASQFAPAVCAVVAFEDAISVRPTISGWIQVCLPFLLVEWLFAFACWRRCSSLCCLCCWWFLIPRFFDENGVGVECLFELVGE